IRARRQQRHDAPEREQRAYHDCEDFDLLRRHGASKLLPASRRRRTSRVPPKPTSSNGIPITLPYLANPCATSLENARRGGERSLDRIAMSASSCASQSTALRTNAWVSAAPLKKRANERTGVAATARRSRGGFAGSPPP